jgi:hypothetical protein
VLSAWVDEGAAELARAAASAVEDAEVPGLPGRRLVAARELEPALGVLSRAWTQGRTRSHA